VSSKEFAEEVLRHELKANEALDSLVNEYSYEEVDDVLVETAADLVDKTQNKERSKTILIICFRIGQGIESERLVRFAKEHLEEWKAKYE